MSIEALLAEMVRLATAGGAGIGVVLLVLVVGAAVVMLAKKAGAWKWTPPPVPTPPPDAAWNTDPDQGAVVTTGEPDPEGDKLNGG